MNGLSKNELRSSKLMFAFDAAAKSGCDCACEKGTSILYMPACPWSCVEEPKFLLAGEEANQFDCSAKGKDGKVNGSLFGDHGRIRVCCGLVG